MFPSAPWGRLKLFALDATDLALSKLERNAERDREDVGSIPVPPTNKNKDFAKILEALRPQFGTIERLVYGASCVQSPGPPF